MGYTELWANLPDDARQEFERTAKSIELKRGDTVYRAGDQPQGLYFVQKGLVGLVLYGSSSGREHLLRFFKTGQFFGHRALFSEEGYHGSTIVLEPTSLKLIPKATVVHVLQRRPELYSGIVRVLSGELRRCEEQRVMILENQILARTAQALVYLKDLKPDHMWTRQEIANFCASTVSTVIKAMAELEVMGLIKQQGRAIEILDQDGLINLQDQ
jgi:CRP-like cAMP-binding protein